MRGREVTQKFASFTKAQRLDVVPAGHGEESRQALGCAGSLSWNQCPQLNSNYD